MVTQVRNGVVVELQGEEHEKQLVKALTEAGYHVEKGEHDEKERTVTSPDFGGYRESVVPAWKAGDNM